MSAAVEGPARAPLTIAGSRIPPLVANHVEAIVGTVLVLAVIFWGGTSTFAASTAAFLMVWVLMAQGWNLLSGFAGPLALGQAAYFGLADFLTLFLLEKYGLTQYAGAAIGIVVAVGVAAIIGGITLNKPGFFFSITSLLVPLILQAVVIYFGFYEVERKFFPSANLAMFWFPDSYPYVVVGGILVVMAVFGTSIMRRRRMGRFLIAHRENARAAESAGVPTFRYKMAAYMMAAALAALAGVLYAQLTFIFDPNDAFDPTVSVQALLLPLVGGVGTVLGPILGGVIVVPAQQFLRTYVQQYPGLDLVSYALLLLVVSLWLPQGAYPAARDLVLRLARRRRPKADFESDAQLSTLKMASGWAGGSPQPAPAAVALQPRPAAAPGAAAVTLETQDLTIKFGGVYANRGVNLKLHRGERVGLIGPNGAGKTTLVNAISGDLRPTSGRVLVDGVDVSKWPPHRHFRHGLGRTFQIANPFPAMTALESVSIGPLALRAKEKEAEDRAWAALTKLRLSHLANRRMRELNSVDSKLVELARLAASDLKVVLLDELLAGLVPGERRFILHTVDEISSEDDWTVLMIEHLISDVRSFCPRVVVLVEGQIIADGDTAQVLRDQRVIEAYLGKRWAMAVV